MGTRRTTIQLAVAALLSSALVACFSGQVAWTSTGGPAGGKINTIAISPNTPGVIYAGTDGGVYITRDNGGHWQSVSQGLPDDPMITALTITRDPHIVYAGTHKGIYRSNDAGEHWSVINPRLADYYIYSIVISPQNPEILYAATNTTVLRSDNNGDTWNESAIGLLSARVWSLTFSLDDTTIFAATDTGIYSSRDRGAHWQSSSDGLPDGARPESILTTRNGFLVGTSQGLYRSLDGKIWNPIGGVLSAAFAQPLNNDPRQLDRVFALIPQGIIESTDGGENWSTIPSPSDETPIYSFAPGDNNVLSIGTARGFWRTSNDGANWQSLNTGLVSTSIQNLLFVSGDSNTLLAATRFGLWYSHDYGKNWHNAIGLSDPYVLSFAADPANPKIVYVGTWGSSIFLSKDGGVNFIRLCENLANNAPISSLAAIRASDNDLAIYAGTLGNGLLKSIDGGYKWNAQSAEFSDSTRITTLAFLPPGTLYAGTDSGLYRLDILNPNSVAQSVSSSLPIDEVSAVITDPQRPQELFVAFTNSGLFRSDNLGAQWQRLGYSSFPIRSRFQALALDPKRDNVIHVGTDRGIYRSEDYGQTWKILDDSLLMNINVQALIVDPQSSENLFVGTDSHGVIRNIYSSSTTLIYNPVNFISIILLSIFVLALGSVYIGRRSHNEKPAQDRVWTNEWQEWETTISNALQLSGEANESNMSALPQNRLARALQHYVVQHPNDALSIATTPLALKQEHYIVAQRFLSHWKAAGEVSNNEASFKSFTDPMADQLCTLLGLTHIGTRSFRGHIGYLVQSPQWRLRIPRRFPLIFIPRHQTDKQVLDTLRDFMGMIGTNSYFALVIDLHDTPQPNNALMLKDLVLNEIFSFIVLDENDLRSLLTARDHIHRLVDIILNQTSLIALSPYIIDGPVSASMLFGREDDMNTLMHTIRQHNCAIVGGHKIGKTSLLERFYESIQETPNFKAFYLDCRTLRSHTEYFESLETEWKIPLPAHTPEGFWEMAVGLSARHSSHTIAMFFDSIDALLAYDIANGEHLFRVFRALSQEGLFRYIFSGEKLLCAAMHNTRLASFDLCNILQLSYLSSDQARDLIIQPMQELGITLERGDDLTDQIVAVTAGHPNLVQFICSKLIERIDQQHERKILLTDLKAVTQSNQFVNYFIETMWGSADALERLITLLMLEQPDITVSEAAEMLSARYLQIAPEQIEIAFDNLTLYSILRQQGPKYTFAVNRFPEILRTSQDISDLPLELAQEIKNKTI